MAESVDLVWNLLVKDRASQTLLRNSAALGALGIAVSKFAGDSVKAYSESEDAVARLTFAYNKFPKAANVSLKSMDDLSKSLQTNTVFSDEATKTAEALLLQFNLTGKQVEQLIPLVQDYAAATGQDLTSATTAVGKAFEGNARALKVIGINFKATGNTAKDFATIQADLSAKVGGFATEQGKTAAGQAKILANQYNDLQEQVGSLLVPAMVDLLKAITPVLHTFNNLPTPVKNTAIVIGAVGIAAGIILPKIAAAKLALSTLGLTGATAAVGLEATTVAETTAGNAALAMGAKFKAALGVLATAGGALTLLSVGEVSAGNRMQEEGKRFTDQIVERTFKTKGATEALQQFNGFAKEFNLNQDEAIAAFPKAAAALGLKTSAEKVDTSALQANTGAQQANTQTIIDSYKAVTDLFLAQYDAVDADIAATKAVRDLNKVHKETRQAVEDTVKSIVSAARAAASAQKEPNAQAAAFANELFKQEKLARPGSPLQKALDAYITKLGLIPPSITTRIHAQVPSWTYKPVYGIVNGAKTIIGEHPQGGGTVTFAEGGYVSGRRAAAAGGFSMDEHGYERTQWLPGGGMRITPHSGSMDGPTGGHTFNLVFPNVYGTKADLSRSVKDAVVYGQTIGIFPRLIPTG